LADGNTTKTRDESGARTGGFMEAEAETEFRINPKRWAAIIGAVSVTSGLIIAVANLPLRLAAVEKRAEIVEAKQSSDHELLVRIEENQKRTLERVEDLKQEIRRGK
jgi:hypothetical protein